MSSDSLPITLAVQGGGSLGAYSAGVLESILGDERLEIEGLSGASAGAINSALVAYGLSEGGRERACALLAEFWRRLSDAAEGRRRSLLSRYWPFRRSWRDFSSRTALFELAGAVMADFDMDPATMDPLRQVLLDVIDFGRLRGSDSVRLFVNATDVRSNQCRVFDGTEISASAICASSCIPFLFEPVEIGGEFYWDGGLMGNPAIYPLIYNCESSDVVLVQTTPIVVPDPPEKAADILSRTIQMSSVSTFLRELRAIQFVSRLVEEGYAHRPGLRQIRLHMVELHPEVGKEMRGNGFRADWPYFTWLQGRGREAGEAWLESTASRLGQSSTIDVPL